MKSTAIALIITTTLLTSSCGALPLGWKPFTFDWKPLSLIFQKIQAFSSVFTIAKTISSLSSLSSQVTSNQGSSTNSEVKVFYDDDVTTPSTTTSGPKSFSLPIPTTQDVTSVEMEEAKLSEYTPYTDTIRNADYTTIAPSFSQQNGKTSVEIEPAQLSEYTSYVSPSEIRVNNQILDQDILNRIRAIVREEETGLNSGKVTGVSLESPISSVNFETQSNNKNKFSNVPQGFGYY